MPEFQFQAVDQRGQRQTGQLSANSPNDVVRELSARGLRVMNVQPLAAGVAAPVVVNRPAPAPVQPAAPIVRPTPAAPQVNVVRSRPGSDKRMTFAMAQLASLVKAGITPARAFQELASRTSGFEAQMFSDLARGTGEGRGMADAMEKYPDYFAPGTIGAVRAGEKGGYLPESLEALREQFFRSHKLQRSFWWLGLLVVSSILAIPWALGLVKGIDKARTLIDDPTATPSDGVKTLFSGLGQAFLSPMGIITVVLLVAYFVIQSVLRRPSFRRARHRFVLNVPFIRARTIGENLGHFNWNLAQLSQAGVSPDSAWRLAADAVPNVAYAEQLKIDDREMAGGMSMVQIARRTNAIPIEYQHLIETGEMTGTLPDALRQCGQMAQADVPHSEKQFVTYSRIAMMVCSMVIGAVAFYLFSTGYFRAIMKIADIE